MSKLLTTAKITLLGCLLIAIAVSVFPHKATAADTFCADGGTVCRVQVSGGTIYDDGKKNAPMPE